MEELKQDFKFNERTKELTIITKSENDKGKREYIDTFSAKQTSILYQNMLQEKKNVINMIDEGNKKIENLKQTQKTKLKLTKEQKQLIKDLRVLKQYEPIENAKTQQVQVEEQLKALNEQLIKQKKIINKVNIVCRIN